MSSQLWLVLDHFLDFVEKSVWRSIKQGYDSLKMFAAG